MYEVSSPDGLWHAAVILYEPYLWADQRLMIEVRNAVIRKEIYKNPAMDVSICFAEIAWSDDSRLVGILVQNCYGPRPIILGYDVRSQELVDRYLVEPALRKQIQTNYPKWSEYLSDDPSMNSARPDELQFATTDQAQLAFAKRLGWTD